MANLDATAVASEETRQFLREPAAVDMRRMGERALEVHDMPKTTAIFARLTGRNFESAQAERVKRALTEVQELLVREYEKAEQRRRARDGDFEIRQATITTAPVAPRKTPTGSRPRVTRRASARITSRDDPDPEPPPQQVVSRSGSCAFETQVSRQSTHTERPKWRARKRRQREQWTAGTHQELLERGDLGVAAVRAGADPLGVLALVVAPPEHPEIARQLLQAQAVDRPHATVQIGRLFEVNCLKSRPFDGRWPFPGSTLMRELILDGDPDWLGVGP